MGDYERELQCKFLNDKCMERLTGIMQASPLYTEKDLDLERRGLKMFEEKMQTEELKQSYENTPALKSELDAAEQEFNRQMGRARANNWITDNTLKYWTNKLSSKNYHWSQKVQFIYDKLPHLVSNWEKMTNDIKKIKDEIKKDPTLKNIPAVNIVETGKGLKKFTDWRNAISEALGIIEATKRGRTELFKEAKQILSSAVKKDVLSSHKVGEWLHRIFESNAPVELIRKFVQGSDDKSLKGLIGRWTMVRERYDKIEIKRVKVGTPRSFSFVKTEKFLDWHYSKRLAYVEEAEKRFTDIEKENPLILDIRRELDCEDWATAAHLIGKAENELVSEKDKEKLKSLKRYLKEHQTTGISGSATFEEEGEDPHAELERLLSILPSSLQSLYRKSIHAGKFKCLSSIMYNRVWCHEKGRVLDDNKEEEMRQHATEDTRTRLEEGDNKDQHVATDVDSYKEPSIRSYSYTGINKSQTLFVSSTGHDALVAKMHQEDSYLFRYWTTLIPDGVDYGTHSYVVNNINYKIKSCLRKIESPKASVASKPSPSKSAGATSYAMSS